MWVYTVGILEYAVVMWEFTLVCGSLRVVCGSLQLVCGGLDGVWEWELKGPKREIFVAGIFAQIRPIWLGYLVTRPKNPKK